MHIGQVLDVDMLEALLKEFDATTRRLGPINDTNGMKGDDQPYCNVTIQI